MGNKYKWVYNTSTSLLYNLLLAMVSFQLCRLIFVWVNSGFFADLTFAHLLVLFKGGLAFDLSAILYTNLPYLVFMLFPVHYKETKRYQQVTKGVFVVVNVAAIIVNLMDTVFFQYTNRRTTASIFSEFQSEDNLLNLIGLEAIRHWYLVLLAVLLGFLLFRFYKKPETPIQLPTKGLYYLTHAVILGIAGYLTICGMRGGFGQQVRPITISNANKYVNSPKETAIVLNTPFSLYRTIGKKPFVVPDYGKDREAMTREFSPLHLPEGNEAFTPLNVVVLLLESFGKENSGFLNPHLDNGTYKGYTPFLDSLMREGLTYKYAYANGRKSIDAMPSVLSSIPMFVEPFILTPASLNELSGIAGELRKKGYHTSFFHGATNGSMGFEAYAKASGFSEYYGRTEYNNNKDDDGNWGIWDEPFLQFFAKKLSTFRQPFMSSVFTLSSHHPFHIPPEYDGRFPKGTIPIHQCIGYTDYALKKFFETASGEDWFKHTLFVITADHTNANDHAEYQTDQGIFAVPVVFYTPNGALKGLDEVRIANQIDIMPTALGYLGYDNSYIAFGSDLLRIKPEDSFSVNYFNGVYQFFKGDYLLQFDGESPVALYRFKTDILLTDNLLSTADEATLTPLLSQLKSIIQQYMERMTGNQLVVKDLN